MAAVTAIALPIAASGQSIFVDLEIGSTPEVGGGAPSSAFAAAAGVSGFWNMYGAAGPPPALMRGLDGQWTNVLLTGPTGGGSLGFNNPNLSGDFRALMADATVVNPSKSYTLSGLQNGFYKFYCYAVRPQGTLATAFVTVSGSTTPNPQIITGPLTTMDFMQGVNYSLHEVFVSNGTLTLNVAMGQQVTYLNGFQLVAVPEPASLILLASGSALLMRRRKKR